jgi:hypothetical protein
LLGGGLWWVTRRLYGNLGGYTALALYCFSPAVLKACVAPNAEVLAALGVYGGIYTCIGVAHAMQGPRRKWRPRIVLLAAAFGLAAAAHLAALLVTALLGLAFMLWVAEGHRRQVLAGGAGGRGRGARVCLRLLRLLAGCLQLLLPLISEIFRVLARSGAEVFSTPGNAGITVAAAAAGVLFLIFRRTRYFGNATPLICALALILLVMKGDAGSPWLWALPFLLTFVGGVFADAYESQRRRLAVGAGAAMVLLQAVCCMLSLPGLR